MARLNCKSALAERERPSHSAQRMFNRERALTDLFSVSGLFPCTDEANVYNYLVRQHLLQETRQELHGIIYKVPHIRLFYTRHCGMHTPTGARRRTLKKRVLPAIAYTNLEPKKSESSETIACADTVSALAALNTNTRCTIGRARICHQSNLLNLGVDELVEMINKAREEYTQPRETHDIIDMRDAVDTLYNLETESPFNKTHDKWLALVRAQMKEISQPEDDEETAPKRDPKYLDNLMRCAMAPRKSPVRHEKKSQTSPQPYNTNCFLGKKRVFPAKKNTELPEITTFPIVP